MDIGYWANLATIIGGILALLGGIWAFVSYVIIRPIEIKMRLLTEMIEHTMHDMEEKYVKKELYDNDREVFIDTLKAIRTDVCSSVSSLTQRLDTLFTTLITNSLDK